jgi:hypothetical protein
MPRAPAEPGPVAICFVMLVWGKQVAVYKRVKYYGNDHLDFFKVLNNEKIRMNKRKVPIRIAFNRSFFSEMI